MTLTEAALDAEWKKIQKKTFTRWCNEHLKKQSMAIDDLAMDFSDGIKLIVLLEVLSGKKLGRYSKKPRIHAQRMENVEMALDFIMKKERIRLVNIGKCNKKYSRCLYQLYKAKYYDYHRGSHHDLQVVMYLEGSMFKL